jgi:D-lactate dehydrogenase (cytochrome)
LFNKEKSLGLEISPTLLMEFHGPTMGYLTEIMEMAEEICKENGSLAFNPGLGRDARNRLFEARHELGEMITRAHPDCRIQVLDAAVPISAYPEIIALARQAPEEAGIKGYAFSHAGDGNLHLCLAGRKDEPGDWDRINQIGRRLVSKAISLGGTATGEHGVGIGKRKYMPEEHGSSMAWMKRIKTLLDPNGILNPGKIFP